MRLFDQTLGGLAGAPVWAMLLLKVTALLAVAWLIHVALARANPQWRVLLWRGTAVGLAVLPLTGVMLPGIELSVERPHPVVAARAPVEPAAPEGPAVALPHQRPLPVAKTADAASDTQRVAAVRESDSFLLTWSGAALGRWVLPAVWLGGFVLLAVRLGIGYGRIRRVLRSCEPAPDWVIDECRRVAGALGYGRVLPIRRCPAVSAPVLCGLWRPVVLLPERMCQTAYREELAGVLAHELAHARFADCPWNAWLQLVSMLLWFHPLCWRMRRAHQSACDAACDAIAAGALGDTGAYCRMLARVAVDGSPPPAAGIAMAGLSNVTRRLRALRRKVFDKPLRRRSVAAFAVTAMLGIVLIGGLRVVYAQPLPKEKRPNSSGVGTAARQRAAKTAEGEMRVRVVDPSGKPVLGAKLQVALSEAGQQTPTRSEHTCGPDGIVVIRLPKEVPAALSLSVSADGRVPLRAAWANFRDWKQPIPAEFTFTLEEGVPIGGVVHDEQGKPIEGAEVRISATSLRSADGPIGAVMGRISVETDAEGKWRSNVLRKDLKRLRIALGHEDHLDKFVGEEDVRVAKLLEPLEQQKAVLVMKRGITVEGTVTDPQGAPISRARVTASQAHGASSTGSYARGYYYYGDGTPPRKGTATDRQGHYRLRGLRPGPWYVGVGAPGLAVDMREVEAEPGMAPVDFQLQKGRSLRIRVVDGDGKPVAGASVRATSWRNGAPMHGLAPSATTDEQGEWSWDGAPADEMTFAFLKRGYMEVIRSDIQARDEPYVITLPPPLVISGRVVDAETKAPIQQFRLFQTGSMGPGRGSYMGDLTIADAADPGTYRVEIPRVRHTRVIRIEAPAYHPAESRQVESDEGNVTIDFELRRARTVAGTVRLPTGDPAVGAGVFVCSKSVSVNIVNGKDARTPRFLSATTDAAGRFTVQLKDEPYTLVVLDERGFAEDAEEQLAASKEITIRPWARVEGTVEIAGRPAPSQDLSLYFYPSVRPTARSIEFYYSTRSDADGRFTFERVIPGTGYVSCSTESGTSVAGIEVELASGQTTTIQIDWTGVPVADRLELPANADKKALSQWARAVLSRKPLSPPVPRDLRQKGAEVREQLYQEWRESPEGKRSQQYGGLRYGCKIGEDGSFRFDEVPAGVYQLRVTVPIKHDGPAQLIRFAEAIQEVTVPETPGRPDGQPFDLGVLKLEFKQTPGTMWFGETGSGSEPD